YCNANDSLGIGGLGHEYGAELSNELVLAVEIARVKNVRNSPPVEFAGDRQARLALAEIDVEDRAANGRVRFEQLQGVPHTRGAEDVTAVIFRRELKVHQDHRLVLEDQEAATGFPVTHASSLPIG